MKNFLLSLSDWIYRKKCFICSNSEENERLCSKCFNKIEFLPLQYNRIILDKRVYCACEYDNVIKQLIRNVKYHNQKELAVYQAKVMYSYWKNLNKNDNYIVVPVPLSKERLKKRKYNQVEIVATEFCKLSGYTINTELIKRIKNTKAQYKLTRKERLQNLKDAFRVNPQNYNNEPILLIDDVCTTGATLESIIKEFAKHGITNMTCFTTATPIK